MYAEFHQQSNRGSLWAAIDVGWVVSSCRGHLQVAALLLNYQLSGIVGFHFGDQNSWRFQDGHVTEGQNSDSLWFVTARLARTSEG